MLTGWFTVSPLRLGSRVVKNVSIQEGVGVEWAIPCSSIGGLILRRDLNEFELGPRFLHRGSPEFVFVFLTLRKERRMIYTHFIIFLMRIRREMMGNGGRIVAWESTHPISLIAVELSRMSKLSQG
jgi:hypothetical protein